MIRIRKNICHNLLNASTMRPIFTKFWRQIRNIPYWVPYYFQPWRISTYLYERRISTLAYNFHFKFNNKKKDFSTWKLFLAYVCYTTREIFILQPLTDLFIYLIMYRFYIGPASANYFMRKNTLSEKWIKNEVQNMIALLVEI